ncbi:hypothetical protein JW960_24425 [candidate division KSB1 bacterium]|nr:hypothetical protein [candidate division KSB1 bacterium]
MKNQDCIHNRRLINSFSQREKILMRFGLWGFVVIGGLAIFAESLAWGLFYLLFAIGGGAVVVLWAFCPYCPYPTSYNTCLFIPLAVFKRWGRTRQAPMTTSDKFWAIGWTVGLVIIPLFWIWRSGVITFLFLACAIPMFAATARYYCTRCRNTACPINKVSFTNKEVEQ